MSEPITNLSDAVAALGALPVPVGPEPQALVGPQAPAFPPAPETFEEKLRADVARLQGLLAEATREVHNTRRERDLIRERVAEPFGCKHCGEARRSHGRRYVVSVGMHSWVRPSDEQVKDRMLARRAARFTSHPGRLARLLVARTEELLAAEARVAELEAERAKYVGREPTIEEEMAYLSRCIDSVLDLCDAAERKGITSGGPFTVEAVRKAADGLVERRSYPPALPWAQLMGDEDLREFLGDLGGAVLDYYRSEPSVPDRDVLASIEKACADWRLIAEAQHGHNTAPGPDSPEMRSLREALTGSPDRPGREPEGEFHSALHHTYRVGHDLPETGGEHR